MPGAFATQLINAYAKPEYYIYSDAIQVKTAVTLAATFSAVNMVEPWEETKTEGLLQHHPVAWFRSLSATIVPLPGIFGRMCTLYGGWAAKGVSRPATVADFMRLHGAFTRTFGGVGDPGTTAIVINCTFDDTMTEVLKTPYNTEARAVFYYAFLEVDITDKAQDADRFMIHMRGEYEVQGRY